MMSRIKPENEYEALVYAVDRLSQRFPDVAEDVIMDLAVDELQSYGGAHVRDFIPVLVERGVSERLRTRAA
jgi:hypothetical protein